MNDLEFEIIEHIGVITKYDNNWKRELNVVSWNGSSPRFDVRDWDEQHEHRAIGITLHEGEIRALHKLLNETFGGK